MDTSFFAERAGSIRPQCSPPHWRPCESKHKRCFAGLIQPSTILGRAIVLHKSPLRKPSQLTWPRETAAEENGTVYYPILDRVSQGYFDKYVTEQELYTAFVDLLHNDGHITEPEALASFEFALSVRSAAPRIEAHYQFYNTSVEPSLLAEQTDACGIWISFGGKQYCSPQFTEPFGDIKSER